MKNIKYIKYAFLLISVLTLLYFVVSPNVETAVSVMLRWAYISLGLTVLVTILFPLVNLITNPRGAMRSLIGLGIVVVVIAVCYALSSTTPVPNSAGGFFEDAAVLKLSDTGLYAGYVALAATVLVVIGGEIRNAFK